MRTSRMSASGITCDAPHHARMFPGCPPCSSAHPWHIESSKDFDFARVSMQNQSTEYS